MITTLLVAACTATGGAPEQRDYPPLVAALQAGESEAWGALDEAFLREPDFPDRLEQLGVLHDRASQRSDAPRAQLVEVADRMLELYYGDLQAHELRHRLALGADDTDTARFHENAADAIEQAIATSGEGSVEAPYQVVYTGQARAWLQRRREEVVGGVYVSEDDPPKLHLVLEVAPEEEKGLEDVHFDLTSTFRATQEMGAAVSGGQGGGPSSFVAARARQGDPAAQTAYALTLWRRGPEYASRAVQYLQAASDAGNVVAQETLGVIYASLAAGRSGDEAEQLVDAAVDQFLLAVGQGSSTAMVNLAQLYLSGHFGDENRPAGVALLRQAVDRENLDAMVVLARLHYNGQLVAEDVPKALDLLVDAAEAGHPRAQLFYVRHQLQETEGPLDERSRRWLASAAEDGGLADAMMLRGTLLARGERLDYDAEAAVRWLERAAVASGEAETVNSVAWILAVAEDRALRRPRRALALMDELMATDELAAANPAYLDTWAAAHAANERFERAVEIQQEAVRLARGEDEDDEPAEYLPILDKHLELFRAGETVTEEVP